MGYGRIRKIRGKEISVIFQDPMTSLNPIMPLGKQISEPLRLHMGLDANEAQERTIELFNIVGIPSARERLKQYPHEFSGGMLQRVMIAMGLSCNPKILIADEPTTALDVTIQAQILNLVKDLKEKIGMSIIWISHDLGVVAALAERIIVMYAGLIVEEASVHELYKNPLHPYTKALLKALPTLNTVPKTKLATIGGVPPVLNEFPTKCPFVERCLEKEQSCLERNIPEIREDNNHKVRCWKFW
jgi:oligopeptide/dipeptide ABC transporter ATP-binding protein